MALQLSNLGFSDNAVMSAAQSQSCQIRPLPTPLEWLSFGFGYRSSPINGVRSLSQHEASTVMQPLMLFFRNWSFLYAERATQEQSIGIDSRPD
jgi:hypothetical protein